MGKKESQISFFYRKLQENERRSDRNRSPGRPSTNQERHQGRKNDQPVLRMVVIGRSITESWAHQPIRKNFLKWLLIVVKYPEDFMQCRKELHWHCFTLSGHQMWYSEGFCVCVFLFRFFFPHTGTGNSANAWVLLKRNVT